MASRRDQLEERGRQLQSNAAKRRRRRRRAGMWPCACTCLLAACQPHLLRGLKGSAEASKSVLHFRRRGCTLGPANRDGCSPQGLKKGRGAAGACVQRVTQCSLLCLGVAHLNTSCNEEQAW